MLIYLLLGLPPQGVKTNEKKKLWIVHKTSTFVKFKKNIIKGVYKNNKKINNN